MYDTDPRREWVPAMRNYKPWELEDLTPPELEALTQSVTAGSGEMSWAELTGTG